MSCTNKFTELFLAYWNNAAGGLSCANIDFLKGLITPAFSSAILSIVLPRNSVWSMPIDVIIDISESMILVASNLPPKPTSNTATSKSDLLNK